MGYLTKTTEGPAIVLDESDLDALFSDCVHVPSALRFMREMLRLAESRELECAWDNLRLFVDILEEDCPETLPGLYRLEDS